jgi:hypothetical protein
MRPEVLLPGLTLRPCFDTCNHDRKVHYEYLRHSPALPFHGSSDILLRTWSPRGRNRGCKFADRQVRRCAGSTRSRLNLRNPWCGSWGVDRWLRGIGGVGVDVALDTEGDGPAECCGRCFTRRVRSGAVRHPAGGSTHSFDHRGCLVVSGDFDRPPRETPPCSAVFAEGRLRMVDGRSHNGKQ